MAEVTWNGSRLATGQAIPAGRTAFVVTGSPVTAVVVTSGADVLATSTSASVTVDLGGLPSGPAQLRFAVRNGRSTVGNYDRRITVLAPVWPGPGSTGVPAGVELRESGPIDVVDGTVLDGLHIVGPLTNRTTAAGGGATVRNCLIEGPVRDGVPDAGHLVLVDTEVVGIVRVADATGIRLFLHGANDLWAPTVESDLIDSYLLMPVKMPGLHPDCAQFNQGTHTVEHCTFDAWGSYDDADRIPINSCVQVTADQGRCEVTVADSSFRGGNYSVNLKTQDDAWLTLTGSTFGEAKYGPIIGRADRMTLADNTWVGTPKLM